MIPDAGTAASAAVGTAPKTPLAPKPAPKKKKKSSGGLSGKQIDKIEQDYGLSYALFKTFPELKRLLDRAIKGSWTPGKFQVELRQSKWFKNHSDVWRKNIALKYSDPASYNQRLQSSIPGLQNLARSVGVQFSNKALRMYAERALLFGWDEAQIRDVFANYVKPSDSGNYGGSLASSQHNLTSLAHQNGIKLTDAQMQGWMRSIARGDGTEEEFAESIRDIAAKTFSLYGDQIKGGSNLYDIASPYVQAMATTLEVNPASLDLFDPTIRKALTGVQDDKGIYQPTSVTAFEDSLRQDKRWQYTQAAQDQARGYVSALSQAWGIS